MPDIDIDTITAFDPLDYFPKIIRASQVEKQKLKKHSVGVYFQNIPQDKITSLSSIPYKESEDLGYFKVDFLHLSILNDFKSKAEIKELLKKEPNWKLLENKEIVQQLFQLSKHFNTVSKIKPTSVMELADCMALIRPAKFFLIDSFAKAKTETDMKKLRTILYSSPTNEKMWFKKSHAVAYALTATLQMHLLERKLNET